MYTIIIEKTQQVETVKQGEYGCIKELFISPEEYMRRINSVEDDNELKEYKLLKDEGVYCRKVYGYLPPQKIITQASTRILQQTVEDIDLPQVIKAINRI